MAANKYAVLDDLERSWRGPTIAEIAKESHVGTATVDRVVNGRSNVRESTRQKVISALERLKHPRAVSPHLSVKRIAFPLGLWGQF